MDSMRKKRWLRVLYMIPAGLIGLLVVAFIILWIGSPGKIKPFYNSNGEILPKSISEIVRTEIGGIEQGMILQGKDTSKPVLLFLHGGPGNPEYVLAKESNVGLEDLFTVCWWEQRGSGMSYSSAKKDSIALEQMILDTVEVTNYLRERFGQEKIYLMGHSWGSFLGLNTVAQHPELYHAYLGIGQVVNQFESEKFAYTLMQSIALENGDKKAAEKLSQYTLSTPNDVTTQYLMLRSELLNQYGYGVFHTPKSKLSLLMPILGAKEYTLSDKYGYAMGSLFSLEQPMNTSQYTTDIKETIPSLSIPAYFFHGEYDRQVSFEIAFDYYEALQAPKKGFYSFSESAHSPFLEEPERFIEIIRTEILGK